MPSSTYLPSLVVVFFSPERKHLSGLHHAANNFAVIATVMVAIVIAVVHCLVAAVIELAYFPLLSTGGN